MQEESTPKVAEVRPLLYIGFLVGCSSPFVRFAEHLAASFALGARDACLLGENPPVLPPGTVGMRGEGHMKGFNPFRAPKSLLY